MLFSIIIAAALWYDTQDMANQQCLKDPALKGHIKAYEDAVSVGQKADSFVFARKAYLHAKRNCDKAPTVTALLTYSYAKASALYQEPVALSLYREAIERYSALHGADALATAGPYIDGIEEAIHRNEPELAYQWLTTAKDILEKNKATLSLHMARLNISLARLYLDVGDNLRALEQAQNAMALFEMLDNRGDRRTQANLYYWAAKVLHWNTHYQKANEYYLEALKFYQHLNKRERRILTIHKRMVGVSHELGNVTKATQHCLMAQQWERERGMELWNPVYDPKRTLSNGENFDTPKIGQILASYTKGNDCKAHDVVIYKTVGIDEGEAKKLIEAAYFAPRLNKDGSLFADQRVDRFNIAVHEP